MTRIERDRSPERTGSPSQASDVARDAGERSSGELAASASAALNANGRGRRQRLRTPSPFGALLAHWRRERSLSQWALALRTSISARHLSFLETGRSRPSEAMIARLATALNLSPAEENALRGASGLAPNATPAETVSHGARDAGLAQRVFETADAFRDAETARDLIERCRPLLRDLGQTHFFCGTIRSSADGAPWVDRDATGAFPQSWLERYVEMGYRTDDPLLREASRAHRSFFWSDVTGRAAPLRRVERRIIAEAQEFGITGGFVTPIRRLDGSVRAVSMMGEAIDARDPRARLALHVIGTSLLDHLDRIGVTSPVVPDLSAEAIECLRWTLAGYTPEAIARRLHMSGRRVRGRLRAACRALDVRDRHQAAARAVALRLIRGA